jgi:hypothetical protein
MQNSTKPRSVGIEAHTPVIQWTLSESIRAALPALLDDPIYANSTYARHIDPALIGWMNSKELSNAVPSALRWEGRAHHGRTRAIRLRLRRLAHIGTLSGIGPALALITVRVQTAGPATTADLYDPGLHLQTQRHLAHLFGPRCSFFWKLELGESGGELHAHSVTFVEVMPVLKVGVEGVTDIRPVTDINGMATYLAKPSDARITSKQHQRTPPPEKITAAVLAYVHTKSLGSLDPADWERLDPLKGYSYGSLERDLYHAGRIARKLDTIFSEGGNFPQ